MTLLLPDINILLYAFDRASPFHSRAIDWLERTLVGSEDFGLADIVVLGFVRTATNRRIFREPASADAALQFVDALKRGRRTVRVEPGPNHHGVFSRICRDLDLRGDDIPDAYLAAIALDANATLFSNDGGFSRFGALHWVNPLAPP